MDATWMKVDDTSIVPPESTPMEIIPLLVVCRWYKEYPVIGWKLHLHGTPTQGWRVDGSPSEAPVTHWMPLPKMPGRQR